MLTITTTLMLWAGALAMPMVNINETTICEGGHCDTKSFPYERRMDVQPGYQWDDAGGYCGSWATQRATLAKGAWISQQEVRNATSPCGGHDEEILSCNIEEALTNLKIDFDGFDYKNTPVPQTKAYFKWLKAHLLTLARAPDPDADANPNPNLNGEAHLAGGNAVAWMIMWSGESHIFTRARSSLNLTLTEVP